MQCDNIPVLLLTGYLGSGKTTLLNRILFNRKGIRFAVIVNDIGEVNIDAALIQKGGVVAQNDDSLIALQNGCICCSLKMDLVQQLHELCSATVEDYGNTGSFDTSKRRFDYIVIEASGICEPAPIAQTICSYPNLIPLSPNSLLPKIDAVVTVVDALRLRDEFITKLSPLIEDKSSSLLYPTSDLAALVIEQIEFCNVILLNKVSEVSREEILHIRAIISAIQPKAKIIECDYCDISFGEILDTELFDFEQVATSAAWIQGIENDEDESHHDEHLHHDCEHEHHGGNHENDCHCEHCHSHHHETHHEPHYHYGISSFVYYRRRPLDLNRFDEFVARHWPKNIIRCKGICYFGDEYDMCYIFEQAGKQFNLKQAGTFYATMPEEELMQLMANDPMLQRDWDSKYGDRMQKLVFIGQDINKDAIIQELDDCLV